MQNRICDHEDHEGEHEIHNMTAWSGGVIVHRHIPSTRQQTSARDSEAPWSAAARRRSYPPPA